MADNTRTTTTSTAPQPTRVAQGQEVRSTADKTPDKEQAPPHANRGGAVDTDPTRQPQEQNPQQKFNPSSPNQPVNPDPNWDKREQERIERNQRLAEQARK